MLEVEILLENKLVYCGVEKFNKEIIKEETVFLNDNALPFDAPLLEHQNRTLFYFSNKEH